MSVRRAESSRPRFNQIDQIGGGHDPDVLRRGQQAFWVRVTLGAVLGSVRVSGS